jgi:hypothetical protein
MRRPPQNLASVEDAFRTWRVPVRQRAGQVDGRRRGIERFMVGWIVISVSAFGGEGLLAGSPPPLTPRPSAPASQPESTSSGESEARFGGFLTGDRKPAIVSSLKESGKPWRELPGGMILVEGSLDEVLAPGAAFFLLSFHAGGRLISMEALWPFVSNALPPDVLQAKQALTGKLGSPRRTGESDVLWRTGGRRFALFASERRPGTDRPSRFWILRLEDQ